MKNRELLIEGLKQIGIEWNEGMIDQFGAYFSLLMYWNSMINLTTITNEEDVIVKHFLDSLLIIKTYDMNQVSNILDLGTGAGFPGIPLKIVFPHLKLTLLDSVNKKVKFLEAAVTELKLENVNCMHGRAEDYANEYGCREGFDLVVSRAVSNLSTLSEYCLPFVKINGFFVAYKSADYELEVEDGLNAIELLGGEIDRIESLNIPNSDIIRTCVLIRKIIKTPKYYPRKAGIPSKSPL